AAFSHPKRFRSGHPDSRAEDGKYQTDSLRFGDEVDARHRVEKTCHAYRCRQHQQGAGEDEDEGGDISKKCVAHYLSLVLKRVTETVEIKPSSATTSMALLTVVSSVQQIYTAIAHWNMATKPSMPTSRSMEFGPLTIRHVVSKKDATNIAAATDNSAL